MQKEVISVLVLCSQSIREGWRDRVRGKGPRSASIGGNELPGNPEKSALKDG